MEWGNILSAAGWFAFFGGVVGFLLALASKIFAVPKDEKVESINDALPGANCGGCGYSGCVQLARAIAEGKAKITSCTVGGEEVAQAISAIMGVSAGKAVKMRAQVMCSGTEQFAKKKYIYEGIPDCQSAMQLGGGDKMCPNGCIGLGTCVSKCPFDAILVIDGVAVVDYHRCTGCGVCISSCPKKIIKLIPFHSYHWVGCMSVDKGALTRTYCEVGCISCRICEKYCEAKAITVNEFVASIDYDKCTGCDVCVHKCPRKIIWSGTTQKVSYTILPEEQKENVGDKNT